MHSLKGQLSIATLGYGFEKLISLIVVTVLVHSVDKAMMGQFFVAIGVCSVAAMIVEFGSANYLVRATARDQAGAAAWLGGVLKIRLPLMSAALLTINAAVAATAPHLLWLYVFTSFYVLFENLYYAFGSTLTGLGAIGARVRTGLIGPLILLALVPPAAWLGWPLQHIVVLYAAAMLLMAMVGFGVVVKRVGWPRVFRDAPSATGVLAQCSWLFAVDVAVLIHSRVDEWMLASMRGFREVAGFAAAYKLVEASRSAIRPITLVLFPHFAAAVQANAWERVRGHGARTLLGAALLGVVAAGVVYAIAPWIVPLLFGREYPESVAITRVLFIASPTLFVGFVATMICMSMHLEKRVAAFSVASIAVNFALNLVVIPMWGGVGAAWVKLASESLFCVSVTVLLLVTLRTRSSAPAASDRRARTVFGAQLEK
ncbi:MAG: oligosaccharide flippase family protein [Steroidobacteraceae bacterium]|jgi:O-antigen/teichoic acid export membrane protein|nr:oligosaccharide flippase family protein [Steroidobacteraceae bacterium]